MVYANHENNNSKREASHSTTSTMQIDRLIIDFLLILSDNYSIVVLLFVLIKPIVQIVLETLTRHYNQANRKIQ